VQNSLRGIAVGDAETKLSEEPGARKPHARICAGGGRGNPLPYKVIANLQLSGIDKWVLSAFQLLFAVSTLAPVVVYIYVDIRVMLLRAQGKIRHEIMLSKRKGKRRV
jgi:hypothetical protein